MVERWAPEMWCVIASWPHSHAYRVKQTLSNIISTHLQNEILLYILWKILHWHTYTPASIHAHFHALHCRTNRSADIFRLTKYASLCIPTMQLKEEHGAQQVGIQMLSDYVNLYGAHVSICSLFLWRSNFLFVKKNGCTGTRACEACSFLKTFATGIIDAMHRCFFFSRFIINNSCL